MAKCGVRTRPLSRPSVDNSSLFSETFLVDHCPDVIILIPGLKPGPWPNVGFELDLFLDPLYGFQNLSQLTTCVAVDNSSLFSETFFGGPLSGRN